MPKDSVTYRDLRNTPGKVWERLRAGVPLSVVAEGEAKALLIPVNDGDLETAREAWERGRALLALGRLQSQARRQGTSELTGADVDHEVQATRKARRKRER